jgi:hypothetical protein
MSPRRTAKRTAGRIAAATAAFVSVALFSAVGAKAEEMHAHRMHVAHHHHHHATEMAAEGGAAPAPVMVGGNYEPSEWGDFECVPSYPGCRPYAAKDWSKP